MRGWYSSGKPLPVRGGSCAHSTLAAAAVLVAALAACGSSATSSSGPCDEQIRARGELRVVTLNLPTCYYLGAQGTEGLEFELASRFRGQLGVKLTMYPVANERAMQAELAAGRADIAAASLTDTPDWQPRGRRRGPLRAIPQLVVYQRERRQAARHAAARSRRNSPCAPAARRSASSQRLKQDRRADPAVGETAPSSADPLEDVDSGSADYAIIDAREFSFAHHLYPNVLVASRCRSTRPVQWIVRRGAGAARRASNSFFQRRSRHPGELLAAGAGVLGRHAPLRIRGVARVSERTWPTGCRGSAPGSSRRRRRSASTGGCWPRSATRNPSGIRSPPPDDGALGA